jgi:hypothetical protein
MNPTNPINTRNRVNFLLFVFCFLLYASSLEAKVTGVCSNCHTMHNSQNGTAMAKDDSWNPISTPYESLLIYSCIGCHSATVAGTWQHVGAPVVFNTVAPTYGANGLAAGNFYYVSTTVDNTGHNIFSTNPDNTAPALGNTPPGGTALTAQLRCAGTWGCHGHNGRQGDTAVDDQTIAIKGAHHTDDSTIDGSTVGKSYRFLNGILGKEDTDWEHDVVNTSHNEYQGSNSSATNTISYLCAECHGKFHTWKGGASEVGTASPWLRHPTDVVLQVNTPSPTLGEYANYTTYDMVAPVARPDPDSVPDTTKVEPGIDIVMCLSCHRAHASPYFKMMRWDYKGWPTSGTNGCNVCHTTKG